MLKINLYDSNWGDNPCSVAYQKSQYLDYLYRLKNFDGITLFTDEWINNPIVDEIQSKYKVGWLREPYCLHPQTYEKALSNLYKLDLLLTYYEPFLNQCEGVKFCPYAGTWLDSLDWGIKPKSKLCSMLIGSKMSTEGHKIRHEIADMVQDNGYQVDFYGVLGTPVNYSQETKLDVLSDYCFSIVTETCREDNLFTEWLLDCFAVGTIPIYWGCPNAYRFFDTNGILMFDTVYRCQKVLASLSFELWTERLSSVYLNLLKMREYAVTDDWLYLNVFKEL